MGFLNMRFRSASLTSFDIFILSANVRKVPNLMHSFWGSGPRMIEVGLAIIESVFEFNVH